MNPVIKSIYLNMLKYQINSIIQQNEKIKITGRKMCYTCDRDWISKYEISRQQIYRVMGPECWVCPCVRN